MKKLIFTFLACVVVSLSAFAGSVTYTMSSYNNKVVTDDQEGTWTLSAAASSSNQLPANTSTTTANDRGVCLSKASGVTMTSSATFSNVISVTIEMSANNATNSVSVTVGGTTIGSTENPGKNNHVTKEFSSDTPLSGNIVITITSTSSIWIGAVTVETKDSAPVDPNKQDPEISFSPAAYEITLGDEFDAPTLTNPHEVTVAYASNNTAVAEVVEGTGAVTVKGEGEATITATFAGDPTYNAATASYTLKVNPKPFEVVNGVFDTSHPTAYGATLEFTTDGNHYETTASTWTAGDVKMVVEGKYRMWSNGKDLRLYVADANTAAGSLTFTVPEGYAISSIVFTKPDNNFNLSVDESTGTIDGTTFTAKGAPNSVTLTAGAKTYINKATVSYGPAVTIGETGYATLYYGEKNLEVPAGVEAWTYVANTAGALTAKKSYHSDDIKVIPAGEAVLLYTKTPATYVFNVKATAGDPEAVNHLMGTDAEQVVTAEAGKTNYFLAKGTKGVGFYQVDATGTHTNGAHKAYLSIATPATGAPAMVALPGAEDVDGIVVISIDNVDADNNMYDIMGRPVNADYKGLVIKNGKKFINK